MNESVDTIRTALLMAGPDALEELVGDLLGDVLGVQVRRAGSGSQRGGDGGTGGAGGRRLIYEARRYRDTTHLDERSIRGEIDQAVEREPGLEAWILVTTKVVSEQVATAMEGAGRPRGVATFIVDWSPKGLPRLAVLCASKPDAFGRFISGGCEKALRDVAEFAHFGEALGRIKSDLESWAMGFELVRQASHRRVEDIWRDGDCSVALFNQNVAGGAKGASHVRRRRVMRSLDEWYGALESDALCVIAGGEGMGKTWAVMDWLQSGLLELPIVVAVSSSSIGTVATRDDVVRLLGSRLKDLDHGAERETEYWDGRVRRLMHRPLSEGPAVLVYLDGLNEQPSHDWRTLLNLLYAEPFRGRIRVLVSARASYVTERMGDFAGLAREPTRVTVAGYDLSPGGEFEQKLKLVGVGRDELSSSVIELASVPRLFDLVMRLREKLGGVENVTVHRLLWEYGESAISASSFGKSGWREFVLDLARAFRVGRRKTTQRELARMSDDPSISRDDTYRRTSDVIDGVAATLSDDGDLTFEPDFVHYALGLALLKAMEQGDGGPEEQLERFLQPIEGYDERAEIIRAAVSVELARRREMESPGWLGALCAAWVQSQNLPEEHVAELNRLARELVEPLLDAIEMSEGYARASPRYIAVNALYELDRTDRAVVRKIARRGARWHRLVSLEQRNTAEDVKEDSNHGRRRRRLNDRIGTAKPGIVRVLGREIEIVGNDDEGLVVAAAQLLQGRPLVEAIDFLEAGAVHAALTGEHREEQRWLNVLNDVDPVETAQLLGERAREIVGREAEAGIHPGLSGRVGAILLGRTGYDEDAGTALEVDSGIDTHWSYERDYLSDPAKSHFGLERRHVVEALQRRDIPLATRIQRAKEALLDPSFVVPEGFGDELVEAVGLIDLEDFATRRSADWRGRELMLALARVVPEELARFGRAVLRGFARRKGEGRSGAALFAMDSMLIVGEEESAALRMLRGNEGEDEDGQEWVTQVEILIAEIQSEATTQQIRTIVEADLGRMDGALVDACGRPSTEEVDGLARDYSSNVAGLVTIAEIVCEKDVPLGDVAFGTFMGILEDAPKGVEVEAVWVLLAMNATERLGRALDCKGWGWSTAKSYIENIMGSRALAAATEDVPMAAFASRVVPSELLHVASSRGNMSSEDLAVVVESITAVVMDTDADVPEPGVRVWHERSVAEKTYNYIYTSGAMLEESDDVGDAVRLLERITSSEQYEERRRKKSKSYYDEVTGARVAGAHFYLSLVDPTHFSAVLEDSPEVLEEWLQGMETRTTRFVRRVRLANGFFVSLCEALIMRGAAEGVALWRVLRECVVDVRFTEHGIDRLTLALFRAPAGREVEEALAEVCRLDNCRHDGELIDLVIAARLTDRLGWLAEKVARDARSACPLDQRRAAFLEQVAAVAELAGDSAWPTGWNGNRVRNAAWKLAQREAFAAYWLRQFTRAATREEAYAAWLLFLACVDRRAESWVNDEMEQVDGPGGLGCAKVAFERTQRRRLKREAGEKEKGWSETFAGETYPKALQPWNG